MALPGPALGPLRSFHLSKLVSGLNEVNFVGTEVIPEPSTWALMLNALALLGFYARRKTATRLNL